MRRSARSLLVDLRWGLGWTSGFVLAYSAIAGAVYVIAGPPDGSLSFPQILLMYVMLGSLAGVLVGLLRPWFRTKAGATVCGMLVGAVIYLGGGITVVGSHVLREPGAVGLLLVGIVVGGLSGAKWWKQTYQSSSF